MKRLAESLSYGTDHSPFRGSGLEYVQSRVYEAGDPVKAIDWRVTARTGRAHIKEYEAPKRMPVYFFIDTSASMTVSSQSLSKYAWAVQIAGGLAFACLDRISPVGVVGVGERPLRITASLSRMQIMQWLHLLRHYRLDETTALATRLAEISSLLSHRAMLIVLSDLHDPAAAAALRLAAQRHEVIALQLRDPVEDRMTGTGFFHAREAETGSSFLSRGRAVPVSTETMAVELRRGRVDHLVLHTDKPIAVPLREFLHARGVFNRGPR
ncbi:MAG TPA: DUF58 domain-containing protein [Verrucomicrobiales bacterium]|nr:DUF58 domain-containing protein [Verrucomicrobiales bacterium]